MADIVGDGSVIRSTALAHDIRVVDRDRVRRLAEVYDMAPLTDEQVDDLLWERTTYPVAGWPHVSAQLLEIFARGEDVKTDATITLAAKDVDLLTTCLGPDWTHRLLDDDQRRSALIELCRAVDELSNLEYGMHLRLVDAVYRPELIDRITDRLFDLVPGRDTRREVAQLAYGVLVTDAAVSAVTDRRAPGHIHHQSRADDSGCTCGWSGQDLLQHVLEVRRHHEVLALDALEHLHVEMRVYLRELMADPDWCAQYWAARSRADDDVRALFERLRNLGAEVRLIGDEHLVTFSGSGDTAAGTFPLAIDTYDWSRPPGYLLQTWSESVGVSDAEVAKALGLSVDDYRAVVTGSERITPELARRIEFATDTFAANFWLKLERSYRAALIEHARR